MQLKQLTNLKNIFFFVVLISISSEVFATNAKMLLPVDQAHQDPTFFSFRTKLISTIKQRDIKAFESVLDKNIQVPDGSGIGIESFKHFWHYNDKNSPFWDELLNVLLNGGVFKGLNSSESYFWAPYYNVLLPDEYVQNYGVIYKKRTFLRNSPLANGTIIKALSYDIVKLPDSSDRTYPSLTPVFTNRKNIKQWVKVCTLDGCKGYVLNSAIATPANSFCVGFLKEGENGAPKETGKWVMISFGSSQDD